MIVLAIRLRAGRSVFRIPVRGKRYFSSRKAPRPALGTGVLSRLSTARCVMLTTDLLTSAEVKNERSYISTTPIRHHGADRVII